MPRQTTLAFGPKLTGLSAAVYAVMQDGRFYTLSEIEQEIRATGTTATATGISARVREFRKMGFKVESTIRTGKLWQYRIAR